MNAPTHSPISVAGVGTGYVGLTTGVCLAHLGHHVVCVDVDERKVSMLRDGRVPIVEDGLDALMAEAVAAGRLSFELGVDPAGGDRVAADPLGAVVDGDGPREAVQARLRGAVRGMARVGAETLDRAGA